MYASEELINFVFFISDDYYPLAEGTYKAENLPVEVGSTFWFYHPDDDKMHPFYIEAIEIAIGRNKTYVCAFTACSDEFVRAIMSNIHRSTEEGY